MQPFDDSLAIAITADGQLIPGGCGVPFCSIPRPFVWTAAAAPRPGLWPLTRGPSRCHHD